jgi:hypothetical protein
MAVLGVHAGSVKIKSFCIKMLFLMRVHGRLLVLVCTWRTICF